MSKANPSHWDRQMLARICDFCGAAPGEWCRKRTDIPAPYLHSARHYRTRREVYA